MIDVNRVPFPFIADYHRTCYFDGAYTHRGLRKIRTSHAARGITAVADTSFALNDLERPASSFRPESVYAIDAI
jgi:hypothetical protein